ncbi:ABC transporter substrate-binding protein [Gluconacetobacter takamatsuzukensis]|uniref:ABC transporter substrate-binding protein n=1 Tax=Gluconacetobacter takamatsuzukensis TaxID=1286190 RepID=A0A7W4PQN5_9PROT|nr:ABC transporter substrate-binding protein [Gluconacetobacter takamatsuzukensis]MBB2204699.1 ABC transporter substrate-binding protein [Gluconacetobacter takamatsuzukensis]
MTRPLRIGLLRLTDSAPVVIARNHGLFARHDIAAEIVVSPSWSNIADGLAWKMLDAAVIFPPLAIMTALGRRGHPASLRPLCTLSRGGNTLILRGTNPLATPWPAGAQGRQAFDRWRHTMDRRPRLAVVHMYSTHLLILRRFLGMIGVDMDSEIELVVMPPADMIGALADRAIDGGCVGPSWGTEACLRGLGFLVGGSSTVMPSHLEKLLVISDTITDSADRLKAALHDAVFYCRARENRQAIAHDLARPPEEGGLALPARATLATLDETTTPEPVTFVAENVTNPDYEWITQDMSALGWIDKNDRQTLRI